jgi:hypothetical protein
VLDKSVAPTSPDNLSFDSVANRHGNILGGVTGFEFFLQHEAGMNRMSRDRGPGPVFPAVAQDLVGVDKAREQ